LTKDPKKRWQNTSDLASELKWIAESAGKPATAEHDEVVAKGRRRERLYAALAVIFLLAAVVSAVSYGRLARTPARVITAEITPPDKVRFSSATYDLDLALSPDGRALAFCAVDESGKAMLWIRSLDSPTAHPLPGTEGAAYPFWSADSRKLGFFAGSELKSIDAEGGPAVVVAGSSPTDAHGGSWNRDGTILFVPDKTKGVYQVAGSGGTPLPVIAADPRESRFFTHPRFLPDGKHFLYVSGSSVTASGGTYFASLDGREKRLLVGGNTFAMYASGFLLYLRENTLFAQAFDAERGRLKGDRLYRVAEQVARTGGFIHNSFDASENGTLVYRMKSGANEKRLEWLDRTGKHQGATGEPGDYWYVRLSPDGQKLASSVGVPNNEIWMEDLARAVRMRLTIEPGAYHTVPVWSPDGHRIVYAVQLGEIWKGIYQKYSNGAGSQELLLSSDSDTPIWPTSWSRDGRFILYSREASAAQQGSVEIWVLPLVGGHGPRRFIEAQPRAYDGQFSPNGRWVAYTSEESGRGEVYVVPFEAGSVLNTESGPASGREDRRWLVSANGGRSPRWRGDGKEIFYLSMANQMMAAEIEEKDKGMVVRTAQALFNCTPALSARQDAPYDVSPDGKKFVISSSGYYNAPLILLVNWTANLK
jgi:Tol biopolymer transport system component